MALTGAFGQNMSQRKGREDTGQERDRRGHRGLWEKASGAADAGEFWKRQGCASRTREALKFPHPSGASREPRRPKARSAVNGSERFKAQQWL